MCFYKLLFRLLKVLTSHSCSEEGLEDAANILLQLSRGDAATRDTVLRLLLSGARHLGYTLCKQIGKFWATTWIPGLILLFEKVFCFFFVVLGGFFPANFILTLFLIGTLLAELREYNLEQQRRAQADSHSPDAPPEDSSISARLKGKMTSRLASDNPYCSLMLFCQHRRDIPAAIFMLKLDKFALS